MASYVFPSRDAQDRVLARRGDDAVAGAGIDEQYEVEIAIADDEMDQKAIEDKRSLEAFETAIEMIENMHRLVKRFRASSSREFRESPGFTYQSWTAGAASAEGKHESNRLHADRPHPGQPQKGRSQLKEL